eukprot:7375978-Prymnesium_polylepis.1
MQSHAGLHGATRGIVGPHRVTWTWGHMGSHGHGVTWGSCGVVWGRVGSCGVVWGRMGSCG